MWVQVVASFTKDGGMGMGAVYRMMRQRCSVAAGKF